MARVVQAAAPQGPEAQLLSRLMEALGDGWSTDFYES